MSIQVYEQGYTWLELVVVLVLVTILGVFIYGSSSGAFDSKLISETKKVTVAFEEAVNDIRLQWSSAGGQNDEVDFNGVLIKVTDSGWAKQLNSDVDGCMTVWNAVLPNSPKISVYNREKHAEGWSAGGGPNVCYFINQSGKAFDEEETPYFRYSYEIGQITRFNM